MGWLGDLVGNLWGGSSGNIGPVASGTDYASMLGAAVGGGGGDSGGGVSSSLVSGLINAGAGLAGTYFTVSANKEQNDAQIALAKEKLAAELALAKKGGGGGGGGGGGNPALQIARMNNLSALYQNWGALVEKGGEAIGASAQNTGKLGQDPIVARLGVLR